MKIDIKVRAIASSIKWEGDLTKDCHAHWAGCQLKATLLDAGQWFWSVIDLIDQQKLVDSSIKKELLFNGGPVARMEAERAVKNYIKKQLLKLNLNDNPDYAIGHFISDLQHCDVMALESIEILVKKFQLSTAEARDLIFKTDVW